MILRKFRAERDELRFRVRAAKRGQGQTYGIQESELVIPRYFAIWGESPYDVVAQQDSR